MNIKDDLEIHSYRNPWVAAAWSLFLPGFGQLYNKDYLIGFVLMAWEIVVNTPAKINLSIFYAFNGKLAKSCEVMDFQWALFYPCVYAFAGWQAYNKSKEINKKLEEKRVPRPEKITHLDGLFIGMLIGLNLGLQWCFLSSPIFGALLGGTVGSILGFLVDRILLNKISNTV